MIKMTKLGLFLFSALAVAVFPYSPAQASNFGIGFFEELEDTIQDARTLIRDSRSLLEELGYTADEVREFGELLGIDLGNINSESSASPSELAVKLYKEWSSNLQASDQVIVNQLILQYAAGHATSLEEMMISNWYQDLSMNQQMRVVGLFAKVHKILELVDDKNTFLAGALIAD